MVHARNAEVAGVKIAPRARRLLARAALAVVLAIAAAAVMSGGSALAALSVSKWEAGTCREVNCEDSGPTSRFYTQAAGHPDFGITDFRFAATKVGVGHEAPTGKVKDVRVDLPPGLAVNPEATEQCTEAQLDQFNCPAGSQVGEDEAVGTANVLELLHLGLTVTEHFPVYNMQRRPGEPARFGVEVNSPTLETLATLGHDLRGQIYLEGGISWQHEAETSESSGVPTGDYHEFFKIQNLPEEPEVIESKLIFWGIPQEHSHVGAPTAFITLPSTCTSKPVTYLHVDSYEAPGAFLPYGNETPVAATGCDTLAFNPSLSLGAEDAGSDQPDGVTADLHVPQATHAPSKPNSPDVQGAQVTLPEGLTLDPSAANGLVACSNAQYAEGSCPEASSVGSVAVNAPGIPDGSLTGGVYVGAPEAGAGPESGGEYRMFLIATAPQYGVGLRLEGRISANALTGRLIATFSGAPQVPFEDFVIHLRGGSRAPLANPLACGPAHPGRAGPAVHRPEPDGSRRGRLLRERMPTVAAVLARTDAGSRKSARGCVQSLHVRPRAGGRPAVPLPHQRHAAAGARGRDPLGAAVQRRPGQRRDVSGREPDRHGRGGSRRRRRTVRPARRGLPHGPVRRRPLWALGGRAGGRRSL